MTDTEELKQLQARNATRLQQLGASGVNINILPALVEHIIESVFTTDDDKRAFYLRWERRAAEILDQVDRDVRLAQLRAPGPIPPPNGHR